MKETYEPRWNKRTKAQIAMAGIVLGVGLFDATCEKDGTISQETDRLRDTKIGKYVVPAVILATAAHLLRVQRKLGVEQLDPIHGIGVLFDKYND